MPPIDLLEPRDPNDPEDENNQRDQNEHVDDDSPGEARPDPLTPEDEQVIRDALTTGGRSMRSVADDPAIKGTFEQVRRVVRRARQADPTFDARWAANRGRQPGPVVQIIGLLDTNEAADELTPSDAFIAAGVPRDAVRVGRFVLSATERIDIFRAPDGTDFPVRVRLRVSRPPRTRTKDRRGGRWPFLAWLRGVRRARLLPAAAAVILLVVLVLLLVVKFRR